MMAFDEIPERALCELFAQYPNMVTSMYGAKEGNFFLMNLQTRLGDSYLSALSVHFNF